MYQFIPLHSCNYLKKMSIETNVALDEGNSRNQIGHWTNDEIGAAVQSRLWVQVELMAWYLSRLERLNEIQWSWVQIPLGPTFCSCFKESFGDIYILQPQYQLRIMEVTEAYSEPSRTSKAEMKKSVWRSMTKPCMLYALYLRKIFDAHTIF